MSKHHLSLDDWFEPLDLDQFRRSVLGRQALFVPPRPELADRLVKKLAIDSLDDLLALRGAKVYAWFHKLDGELAVAPISAASGRSFFDAGTTLYFRKILEFGVYQTEVAKAFALPQTSVDCTLFCNRPHAVTRAHFDTADIITIQLKGRKTWRIAPNKFAPMPLRGYATQSSLAPELRIYASEPPPSEMPADASTHVLEKGAVLHIPRGYWHETSSDQDSLSLHIQIATPSRIEVAMTMLKNELARDEWWREPAYDFGPGDPSVMERATATCTSLRKAVSRLDARDLVHLPVREREAESTALFVRCGQASFGISSVDTQNEIAHIDITSYQYHRSTVTALEMSVEFVSACRWINELPTGTAFDVPELLRAAPGLNASEARELLSLLERTRLVRRQENDGQRPDA